MYFTGLRKTTLFSRQPFYRNNFLSESKYRNDVILQRTSFKQCTYHCYNCWQVLQALEYLHNQRIVHRDIKPDNLLLQRSKTGDDVTVKITDFGLARRLPDGSDTLRCEPSGAPMFLAPETILEEPVGCPVDMWATGVILYLMLVGYPPFWSSSDEFLLLSILQGRYTMPSPYWDNIKAPTKELVQKLIVQQPEQRLTASQALAHTALSDGALGRKVSVERETKRNFLAVACGIRAMVKFKRANVKSASRRLSERGADLKSPVHVAAFQYDIWIWDNYLFMYITTKNLVVTIYILQIIFISWY